MDNNLIELIEILKFHIEITIVFRCKVGLMVTALSFKQPYHFDMLKWLQVQRFSLHLHDFVFSYIPPM